MNQSFTGVPCSINGELMLIYEDKGKITLQKCSQKINPIQSICDNCVLTKSNLGDILFLGNYVKLINGVTNLSNNGSYIYKNSILVNPVECVVNNLRNLSFHDSKWYASYNNDIVDYEKIGFTFFVLTSNHNLFFKGRIISNVSQIKRMGDLMLIMYSNGLVEIRDQLFNLIRSHGIYQHAQTCDIIFGKYLVTMMVLVKDQQIKVFLLSNNIYCKIIHEETYETNCSNISDFHFCISAYGIILTRCKKCPADIICESCSIKFIENTLSDNFTLIVMNGIIHKLQFQCGSIAYTKTEKILGNILLPGFSNKLRITTGC